MSKAFTKEDDGGAPPAPPRRRGAPVPEPNPVTPAGAAAARAELDQLARDNGDPDRIRELSDHLATAVVVHPDDRGVIGLGATVTLETDAGDRRRYTFVGAIEADVKRGRLSWQTDLANALWGTRVSDIVALPRGDEVTIIAIDYP